MVVLQIYIGLAFFHFKDNLTKDTGRLLVNALFKLLSEFKLSIHSLFFL